MSKGAIHLKITARDDKRYWLDLAVSPRTKLIALDGFLRTTWLECCLHLSAFTTPGRHGEEVDANLTVGTVFKHVRLLDYVYDFGASTELIIKRVKSTGTSVRGIALLGRNEQPAAFCDECDAPATWICPECSLRGGGVYCDEHSPLDECDEPFLLPVVNSPRVGVCGYGE
jgi:hypothetical protein